MKKAIYSISLIIVLLCGCSKVSQEGVACSGSPPPAPMIQSLVITPGSGGTIYVSNFISGSKVVITGPNNYSSTTLNGQVNLDFSNVSNYGKYTGVTYYNGCASAPDTFQVLTSLTIPCSITSDHSVTRSTGIGEIFSNIAGTGNTYLGATYSTIISINSDAGDPWLIYFSGYNSVGSYPALNSIISLDSTGYYGSGNCYINLGTSPYFSHSISGTVYITTLNSGYNNCVAFCSAKFKTSQGAYFTMTGAIPYFP